MINKKYFKQLEEQFVSLDEKKRNLQKLSSDALHAAKRAIFSFHRDDWKTGEELLEYALKNLKEIEKKYLSERLDSEGSFKAAQEEYVEAELFRQFLYKEDVGPIKKWQADSDIYLGGLTDTVGEIVRYAVRKATSRDFNDVKRAQACIEEIVAVLMELNLTGYLRTKFDQAKQARHKMEQVMYEVSLRARK